MNADNFTSQDRANIRLQVQRVESARIRNLNLGLLLIDKAFNRGRQPVSRDPHKVEIAGSIPAPCTPFPNPERSREAALPSSIGASRTVCGGGPRTYFSDLIDPRRRLS